MRAPARAFAFLAVAALSGCEGGFATLGTSGAPPSELRLMGGALVAKGADNYCVSPEASNPRSGLAVMAPCAVLSGEGQVPRAKGVFVIQSGGARSASVAGSEPAMAAFVASEAGRAILSNSGDPADITVEDVRANDNRVVIRFRDAGTPRIAGSERKEWRAFLDLSGRLVTVSLRGFAADPLANAAGRALLDRALDALVAANSPQDDAAS